MDVNWTDLGTKLAKLGLPLLGAALPVPGGMALCAALANCIGKPDAAPVEVVAALAVDPALLEKAREFQAEHTEKMLGMAMQHEQFLYASEVADRTSAREASVKGGDSGRLFVLSMVLLVLCLGSEILVLFNGYPKGIDPLVVGRVLGLLDSVTVMVLAFHYGSSASSARKTELAAAQSMASGGAQA